MRVRTYCFPGCFTRPPGTSTRDHPHEPTTSKPVVPGDVCASAFYPGGRCAAGRALNESDAVPGRLRNPSGPARGPFPFQVARPHTSVASLFAARFRVWIQPSQAPCAMQGLARERSRILREKGIAGPRRALARARRPQRVRSRLAAAATMDTWRIPSCRFPPRRPACAAASAARAAPAPAPGAAAAGNPFGERRASAPRRARGLRERIGGALAAIVALVAKFFAAIKGAVLLLPKLKLLTTAGHRARVGRRVLAVLGLDVRGRLRRAAVRARDGPRDPAAPRGHQGERADVHPVPGRRDHLAVARRQRARRGPRRARGPGARHASARRSAWSIGEAAEQRLLPRARLHRLLPEPLQPAAGRAARRRPRDGRDGAVDVVRRLRRAGRARAAVPEPDPADHRVLRRATSSTGAGRRANPARSSRPPTTASRRATGCSSAPSTSA